MHCRYPNGNIVLTNTGDVNDCKTVAGTSVISRFHLKLHCKDIWTKSGQINIWNHQMPFEDRDIIVWSPERFFGTSTLVDISRRYVSLYNINRGWTLFHKKSKDKLLMRQEFKRIYNYQTKKWLWQPSGSIMPFNTQRGIKSFVQIENVIYNLSGHPTNRSKRIKVNHTKNKKLLAVIFEKLTDLSNNI